ncbi:Lipid-translocating exporter-like protein rta1 [Cryptotrichosporon argae]
MSDSTHLVTGYVPKLWATYTVIGLYGAVALIFWIRFFRSGKTRYMLWVTIGATVMTIGYGNRVPLTKSPSSVGIYSGTQLLTLLSPCAFIAQDYYILPRLATWLEADDCLILRPRLIARIFLISDGITFVVQLAGSGLSAVMNEKLAKAGLTIALIGLIVQVVSFTLYWALLTLFGHRVAHRHPEKWSRDVSVGGTTERLSGSGDWRRVYWALQWTCVGIMVRCIFRVVEFAQGYSGYLRTHEWAYYCLDGLPLLLAILVWTWVWPPLIIVGQHPWVASSVSLVERKPSYHTAA